MSMLRMAFTNQAHAVTGIRGKVMPVVRSEIVVTQKFRALRRAASEKIAALMSHRSIPSLSGRKNEAVMPARDATVSQSERQFNTGKAISSAPICRGRRKLPNPSCGAAVKTKNTISEPWSRRTAAKRSGVLSKPFRKWNRGVWPGGMDAQESGENHAYENTG